MEYLRTWAEIDLSALRSNFENIKKRAGEGVLAAAVIKADAYGHGSVSVARELSGLADRFCVAIIEEALELRGAGITAPIHILGYLPEEAFAAAIENNIAATVWSYGQAKALSDKASAMGRGAEIFIAADTGMSRIGFEPSDESVEEIKRIAALKNLKLTGIFSHLAKADEADKSSALAQDKLFDSFIKKLEGEGIHIPLKSLYNSAGIMDMESKYNLVRAGITLYGIYPSNEVRRENLEIKPVMSLKTRIVHLHRVKEGEGVSYGHIYRAPRETLAATLAAGYADGVPRLLSNRGRVIINGEYAPIIGRVCMDFFMADVTDIPGVKIGGTAIIIGGENGKAVTAEDVAELAGTIGYEITCNINKRVPRVYK